MDESILKGMENFEQVWQRVSGKPCVQDSGDEARLRSFIEEGSAAAELFCELSRRTRGETSAALSAMAARERCALKALQLEHFLLCGDTWTHKNAGLREENGVLSLMRRSYISEGRSALLYADAARWAQGHLAGIYSAAAERKQANQEKLRCLIARAMGVKP